MKSIELVNWPLVGTLAIGDDPILKDGTLRVYELISQYESITTTVKGIPQGRYKHVAVNDEELFVYDFSSKSTVGRLGPYRAYSMVWDGSNHRLVEVKI